MSQLSYAERVGSRSHAHLGQRQFMERAPPEDQHRPDYPNLVFQKAQCRCIGRLTGYQHTDHTCGLDGPAVLGLLALSLCIHA